MAGEKEVISVADNDRWDMFEIHFYVWLRIPKTDLQMGLDIMYRIAQKLTVCPVILFSDNISICFPGK